MRSLGVLSLAGRTFLSQTQRRERYSQNLSPLAARISEPESVLTQKRRSCHRQIMPADGRSRASADRWEKHMADASLHVWNRRIRCNICHDTLTLVRGRLGRTPEPLTLWKFRPVVYMWDCNVVIFAYMFYNYLFPSCQRLDFKKKLFLFKYIESEGMLVLPRSPTWLQLRAASHPSSRLLLATLVSWLEISCTLFSLAHWMHKALAQRSIQWLCRMFVFKSLHVHVIPPQWSNRQSSLWGLRVYECVIKNERMSVTHNIPKEGPVKKYFTGSYSNKACVTLVAWEREAPVWVDTG